MVTGFYHFQTSQALLINKTNNVKMWTCEHLWTKPSIVTGLLIYKSGFKHQQQSYHQLYKSLLEQTPGQHARNRVAGNYTSRFSTFTSHKYLAWSQDFDRALHLICHTFKHLLAL